MGFSLDLREEHTILPITPRDNDYAAASCRGAQPPDSRENIQTTEAGTHSGTEPSQPMVDAQVQSLWTESQGPTL